MSKVGRKIIRRKLRRIVKKALRRRRLRKMFRKGKHVKHINNARPRRGGIMLP